MDLSSSDMVSSLFSSPEETTAPVPDSKAPPLKPSTPLSPDAAPFYPQQPTCPAPQGLHSPKSSPLTQPTSAVLSSSPTSVALSHSPVASPLPLQQQRSLPDFSPVLEDVVMPLYSIDARTAEVVSPPAPPQSTYMVDRGGAEVISTPISTATPCVDIISPPSPVTPEVAWWEGWKLPPVISDDFTPSEIISSSPPPATPMVAWWEGWKSLSSFFLLLFFYYNDNLRFFPRAAMDCPPWSSWWKGWKQKKPTHSPPTFLSSVKSNQRLLRAKHMTRLVPNKPSSLLLLSLLLNLLCFLNLCNLYLSPIVISPTIITNEPFSSAPGPAELELRSPTPILAAPLRAQTDPPWTFPRLTLPVIPLAYCLSLHTSKRSSKFTYASYFSLLTTLCIATVSPLFAPGVERVRLFDSPILLYDPG